MDGKRECKRKAFNDVLQEEISKADLFTKKEYENDHYKPAMHCRKITIGG